MPKNEDKTCSRLDPSSLRGGGGRDSETRQISRFTTHGDGFSRDPVDKSHQNDTRRAMRHRKLSSLCAVDYN